MNRDHIQNLLGRARNHASLGIFGEDSHRYELHPVLLENEITEFEERHGVVLPQDYREFLLSVGNGGAGPAYGLFRLGEMDSGFGFARWRAKSDFVGDLSLDFPFTEAWLPEEPVPDYDPEIEDEDLADEDYQSRMEAWEKKSWFALDGAIPICHLGCAYRQWLVVTGPERGNIWNDNRADYCGIEPVTSATGERTTFSDWYLVWLEDVNRALAAKDKEPQPMTPAGLWRRLRG